MTFRITYSTPQSDMAALHKEFDRELAHVRSAMGQRFPARLGRDATESRETITSKNPSNTKEILGEFAVFPKEQLKSAYQLATIAQKTWAKKSWQDRVAVINKAADIISERKFPLAAAVALEAGKNRMEALGEVEEAADLLRYYAQQVVSSDGFVKPMLKLSSNEDTRSVLRPHGNFAVIAPFNFPFALAAGMAGAALLGGNSVILKPSDKTPWSGELLRDVMLAAGMDANLFQVIQGGGDLGAAMTELADGTAFTGSKDIGMKIMATMNRGFAKPALMELGGKNAAIICESADLDKAAEGCARSAFGYSGQKCSALSRIYVHASKRDEFLKLLVQKTALFKIGHAVNAETFVGPVISHLTVERWKAALRQVRDENALVYVDESIAARPDLEAGYFVSPVIATLPHGHNLMTEEQFMPFVGVDTFTSLDDAIAKATVSTV